MVQIKIVSTAAQTGIYCCPSPDANSTIRSGIPMNP